MQKNLPRDVKIVHLHENFYHQGRVYNLRDVFRHVNEHYFDNKLSPREFSFSWSKSLASGEKRFTFGQFRPPNQILMNRDLDVNPHVVPEFFINAVFYHEVVHYRRYRDGLDYDHVVDFFVEELKHENAGDKFHFKKDFRQRNYPAIEEEIGEVIKKEMALARIRTDNYDKALEPLFQYIDQLMTGKRENEDT